MPGQPSVRYATAQVAAESAFYDFNSNYCEEVSHSLINKVSAARRKHAMAQAIADVIPHWMIATFQTILKLFNQAIQSSRSILDGIVPVANVLDAA
jgi:hypothetical protein